jgi:hypothetical protein
MEDEKHRNIDSLTFIAAKLNFSFKVNGDSVATAFMQVMLPWDRDNQMALKETH